MPASITLMLKNGKTREFKATPGKVPGSGAINLTIEYPFVVIIECQLGRRTMIPTNSIAEIVVQA